MVGAPLATALTFRGTARWAMGLGGWREDLDAALAMARKTDPRSLAALVGYKYTGLPRGMLLADDAALTEIDDALQVAERSSDDIAVVLLRIALGLTPSRLRRPSARIRRAGPAPRNLHRAGLRIECASTLRRLRRAGDSRAW